MTLLAWLWNSFLPEHYFNFLSYLAQILFMFLHRMVKLVIIASGNFYSREPFSLPWITVFDRKNSIQVTKYILMWHQYVLSLSTYIKCLRLLLIHFYFGSIKLHTNFTQPFTVFLPFFSNFEKCKIFLKIIIMRLERSTSPLFQLVILLTVINLTVSTPHFLAANKTMRSSFQVYKIIFYVLHFFSIFLFWAFNWQ